MQKLKTFARTYINSIKNFNYYKDVAAAKTSFSVKYFILLGLFAAVISSTAIAIPLIPEVNIVVNNALDEISAIYPEELVLKSKEGKWEVNQPEPYAIRTPEFFKNATTENNQPVNFPSSLVVFDHNGTIDDLKERDTLVLVNDTNIITVDEKGKIEAYPLESIPEGEINHGHFVEFMNSLRNYARFIPAVIIFFVFVGTAFYYILFRLGYAFLVAFLLKIFLKATNTNLDSKALYRIALHTMTPVLTAEVIISIIGTRLEIPFLFLAANIAFAGFVIKKITGTTEPKAKIEESQPVVEKTE